MAQQESRKRPDEQFARFCVVPHAALAMFRQRPADELVKAQQQIDDGMLSALESMVRAARAGKLEGSAALALEACAW